MLRVHVLGGQLRSKYELEFSTVIPAGDYQFFLDVQLYGTTWIQAKKHFFVQFEYSPATIRVSTGSPVQTLKAYRIHGDVVSNKFRPRSKESAS